MSQENNQNHSRPAYYAIIPAHVRYDKELEPSARLFYGEITALCNQEGYCWASNKYFADLYDVDERTIRRWLESLSNKNYVKVHIDKSGLQTIRKISITETIKNSFTSGQKCPVERTKTAGRADKNVRNNNTYNTTYINDDDDAREIAPKINEKSKITISDVYSHAVRKKFDWTSQEIEEAWKRYCSVDHPISDVYKYLESIINNNRILEKKSIQEKSCKKNTQKEKTSQKKTISKNSSETDNKFYSENDTSESPLAKFARQNGLR